ncbi:hypothetical protein NLT11_004227 [Cronobacter sakazakii]|uniref:hypothetical protein n=1 Tax=Cronobacter sakazakii TaxID=28141 RepID=UPI0002B2A186|nr:hypothetical protein [Cronobacter sakazakii]EGT4290647.1 hypothetical protein [Cronobacter malonaticus]EKY3225813.1 hypothetical protein [Cronobacter dublinensis]ELY5932231.1 hypothetical protein [Cronobacter turicensis]AGE88749.1 hypothetical protein CSSP291_21203 [Cronobacter sakazakii SP291]ALB53109.1 hypothetical protein AFK64_21235 [Cronobacter sakazakii]
MYNNLPALTESILWDDGLLAADYAALDARRLEDALKGYLQAVSLLRGEWHTLQGSPLSLWIACHDQLTLYRPGLLSAERIILTDTLEEAALRLDTLASSEAMDHLVYHNATDRLADIRTGVAQFVRFVKDNFLLIQAGFIAFTPCESARQEQQRKMQLLQDNPDRHFLHSVMPPAVAQLYERSLSVRGIRRVGEEGHFRFVSEKTLPDEIMLELRDCLSPFTNAYMYQELQPVEVKEDGTFRARITRGKHESRKGYDRWVRGAINRSIYFHYHGLLTDISQSARTGASLVTRCPLQGKILQKLDASGRLSRRMLEIDLPFLQDLSLHDIFRIRTDYEPSVTAFRRSLRNCAVEMERASGPDEIRLLQQRFQERIADEGLDELHQKLSIWKRRSIQDTALLAVPAVLGYMGSPSLLNMAAGAVSLLQAALGAHRHHEDVTHHPSWFLLRTTAIKCMKK